MHTLMNNVHLYVSLLPIESMLRRRMKVDIDRSIQPLNLFHICGQSQVAFVSFDFNLDCLPSVATEFPRLL